MGTIFKLAWRNVWRQKRRTFLLILVVAYATLSTIFFWGMVEGQNESMITNNARFILAPGLVTTPAYQEDPDPHNALDTLDFLDELRAVNGINEVAPRVEAFGVIRSAYSNENIMLRGVAPGLEKQVNELPNRISQGRMLEAQGELVLGEDLAKNLDVRLGERVAIDVSSLAGSQAAGLILVGTSNANVAALDKTSVLIHIDDARMLTGVTTATSVALDIPRGREDFVAAKAESTLAGIDNTNIYGLSYLLGDLTEMLEANRVQMIPMGLLFAIFAALAVTSTLFVSVIERSREFGMMGAIGMAPPKLAVMVVFEALVATLSGWLIGLVLGYTLTYIFSIYNGFGQLFAVAGDSFADFGFGEEMYTTNKPIYALYAAVTIVFAAVFAMIVPARRVATMKIAQAMRAD